MLGRKSFGLFIAVTLALGSTPHANAGMESQTFDTEVSAAAAGWMGFNNGVNGNAYGFSDTDFTGGASPAGEAGGTIARTTERSYYGDTSLGEILTLDDPITASGEFNFRSCACNNGIQIGHFDPIANVRINTLGIVVSEPQSINFEFRVRALISLSDGTQIFSAPLEVTGLDVSRTWNYTWDPNADIAGVLIVNLSGSGGGAVSLGLSQAHRDIGASFSAFGLSSGGIDGADPTNVAELYIDNVSYTFTAEDLIDHSHSYLTGTGKGHNNTVADTGPATFPAAPEPVP